MKKLLALVLALVMTLSLCTVSNAAYSDAADVDYKEAVDVMSAVGVFQGADGKFSPKAELTREQAAKLIAYLDLGEATAEALPAIKVFNDVEANRWSAKYVAYCADAGYLAGVGDNNFDPAGKLTGYAFGKMLLCVLGYDAAIEGFTGANWQIAVAKLMQSNKIAKSVSAAASATLTREAAAQYCLNTLKTTMVDYGNKGTTVTINGAVIATGASSAKKIAIEEEGAANYAGNGKAGANYQQLCEKLYEGRLALDAAGVDDFGRLGNKWTYKATAGADAKTVGTYAATADKTVVLDTATTSDATFLAALKDILDNDDLTIAGDATKKLNGGNFNSTLPAGTVVELFLNDDDNDKVDRVVAYNWVLVEVTDVDKYDNESDEVEKYGITEKYTLKNVATDTGFEYNTDKAYVDAKNSKAGSTNYNAIGTWKEDDQFFAVLGVNNAIIAKADVKTVEGKKTAAGAAYVKVDGTKYVASAAAVAMFANYDDTYTAYLDPQGSVIFAEVSKEAETTYNYAYVISSASDFNGANLLTGAKTSAAVKLLYTDGKVETLKYAVTKATKETTVDSYGDPASTTVAKGDYYFTVEGTKYAATDAEFNDAITEGVWYTYTVDSEGFVTLKDADVAEKSVADKALALAADSVKVADTIYADSTTKLTVLDTTDGILKTFTGYKAIREANNFGTQTAGKVLFMTNSAETKATEIFLVKNDYTATETVNAAMYVKALENVDGGVLSVFYVDGKKVEYKVATGCTNANTLAQGFVYDIDVTDNEVTSVTKITTVKGKVTAVGDNYVVVDPTGATGDTIYTFTDDGCAVYQVNAEGSAVSSGTLKAGQNVLVVLESGKAAQAFIYKTNIAYFAPAV